MEADAEGPERRCTHGGLIGSPATIRRTLRKFEESNVDQVILLNQAGKNTHEDICASLELFAREVMPEFHDREPEHQEWKRRVLAGEIAARGDRHAAVQRAIEPDAFVEAEVGGHLAGRSRRSQELATHLCGLAGRTGKPAIRPIASARTDAVDSPAMQPHPIPGWDTELREIADGVFAYTQATGGFCIANAGYITGGDDDGIAIDALFSPPMTQAFKKAVKKVRGAPIRRVVNTHHHVDHTLGNAMFPKASIIAQTRAREHIARNGFPRERLLGMAPWFKKDLKKDLPGAPPGCDIR